MACEDSWSAPITKICTGPLDGGRPGFEDGLEGVGAGAQPCRIDDGANVGLALGRPRRTIAIGHFALDDGRPKRPLAGVVRWFHQSGIGSERQELIAGALEFHLQITRQVACGRRRKNGCETSLEIPAFGRDRRGREGFDPVSQGKGSFQPEPKARRQHVVACLVGIGDIPCEMGEASLMLLPVPLLGRVAIGTPDLWPMAIHQVANDDGTAGWCSTMHDSLA